MATRHEDGIRLDTLLAAHLPRGLGRDLSRAEIRRLVMGGAVRVGRVVQRRPGMPIAEGATVTARVDAARLQPRAEPSDPHLAATDVLFEDDDLIAVAKQAGIATHASADPRRPDLVSLVRAWLLARHPGREPYVGVHQRLDRETSGVLLFTTSERANGALARAHADHALLKVYHALTVPARARLPRAWIIDVPLASRGTGATSRMASSPSGQAARTEVRVLERRPHALLIEARPSTGRRHQIRAHLAEAGLPILGDRRYGAPASGLLAAPRVMLHCARLELQHPVTGAPLRIACDWPRDFRARLGK